MSRNKDMELDLAGIDQIGLLGPHDANLRLLEERFGGNWWCATISCSSRAGRTRPTWCGRCWPILSSGPFVKNNILQKFS